VYVMGGVGWCGVVWCRPQEPGESLVEVQVAGDSVVLVKDPLALKAKIQTFARAGYRRLHVRVCVCVCVCGP
jgi:hypothetical protein